VLTVSTGALLDQYLVSQGAWGFIESAVLEHGLADPASLASPRGSSRLLSGVSSARRAAGATPLRFYSFVVFFF